MKKTSSLFLLVAIVLISKMAAAQNEQDVIRYSQPMLNGSPRFIGMGGAFTALGGDFSAIGLNPASTAVFLNTELSFSLGVSTTGVTADYLNNSSDAFDGMLNIPHFGFVARHLPRESKWKALNFAFSNNRLNDYNQSQSLTGTSSGLSLADYFADEAFGTPENALESQFPFTSYLAYWTYLINPDTTTAADDYIAATAGRPVSQDFFKETSGRQGESIFSFAANYNNKLYIGAGLGIRTVEYRQEERLSETDEGENPDLTAYDYFYDLAVEGSGVNFRLGAIYRISEALRFGVNFQTPTYYSFREEYSASMTTNFSTGEPSTASSLLGENSYLMFSPGKFGFGAAYLLGKSGVISVDYDYIDYSSARLANSGNDQVNYAFENDLVQDLLSPTHNIRIGGEWRFDALSLRAGYGLSENAYKSRYLEHGTDINTFSLGLGYRIGNITADLGLSNSRFDADYVPYFGAQNAKVSNSLVNATIGIGIKF